MEKKVVVAVSGGFDPLHIGHVRMMREARTLGDSLVVILNNDNWLMDKKGYVFMPENERFEMISAYGFVDKVILTDHLRGDVDRSVVRTLHTIFPDIFVNGGDRTELNTPEDAACDLLSIKRVYGVGKGGKVQSSSWMTRNVMQGIVRSVRPWGHFNSLDKGEGWNLKTITVEAGQRLSLQYHLQRSESWILLQGNAIATVGKDIDSLQETALQQGDVFTIPCGYVHRLASENGCIIAEIAYGNFDENDIIRLQDDYARTLEP